MLQTYQAQVHGSQLTWIDQPSPPIAHQRVLIVVERASEFPSASVVPTADATLPEAYEVFAASEACLGTSTRHAIDMQLTHLRDEWQPELDR